MKEAMIKAGILCSKCGRKNLNPQGKKYICENCKNKGKK